LQEKITGAENGAGADEALWLEEHDGPCQKLKKITVNIGLGEASQKREAAGHRRVWELGQITGQKAVITAGEEVYCEFQDFARACPSAAR